MLADLRCLSHQAVLTLRCGPRTSNQDCSRPTCCLQVVPQLRYITCGRVYSDKPHLIAKFDLGACEATPASRWNMAQTGLGQASWLQKSIPCPQCNAACRHIREGHCEALHRCHPCCRPAVTLMLTPSHDEGGEDCCGILKTQLQ